MRGILKQSASALQKPELENTVHPSGRHFPHTAAALRAPDICIRIMTSPAALKELAREMLTTLCNKHEWDSPFVQKHMSPSFSAMHLDRPPTANREEFLGMISTAMKAMPDFHAEIKDIIAEVDQETGKGKVWVFSRMTGFPDGKTQESVDMMEWQGDIFMRGKDVQRAVEN